MAEQLNFFFVWKNRLFAQQKSAYSRADIVVKENDLTPGQHCSYTYMVNVISTPL